MKMVMAVVPRRYGDDALAMLNNAGFTATYSETRGGMLRQSQMTLFIGVRTKDLQPVLDIIGEACPGENVIHHGYGLTPSSQAPDEPVPNEMPFEEGGDQYIDESDDPEPHPTNEGKRLGRSGAVVFIWTLDQYELP